jgi:hypothetical protein
MNSRNKRLIAAVAAGLIGTAGVAASAWAQSGESGEGGGLPQVQTQGDISYTSGGVGQDESQALRREAPHWPLALQFTGPGSDYVADVHVTITKSGGATVLDTTSRGPYMLVKLPAGHYTVRAQYKDATQTKSVNVSKHTVATFHWSEQ